MHDNDFSVKTGYLIAALVISFFIGLNTEYTFGPMGKAGELIRAVTDYAKGSSVLESGTSVNRYAYRTVRYYEVDEEMLEQVVRRYIEEAYHKFVGQDSVHTDRVAKAFVDQFFYVPKPQLVPYLLAIGKQESRFSMAARPPAHLNSSAVGIGQVIWRWHKDKLLQGHDWRDGLPITQELLATDVKSNLDATYIVFDSYLMGNNYNFRKALRGYRGADDKAYFDNVMENYSLLTTRLLRSILEQPVKTKRIRVQLDKEEDMPEEIVFFEEVTGDNVFAGVSSSDQEEELLSENRNAAN